MRIKIIVLIISVLLVATPVYAAEHQQSLFQRTVQGVFCSVAGLWNMNACSGKEQTAPRASLASDLAVAALYGVASEGNTEAADPEKNNNGASIAEGQTASNQTIVNRYITQPVIERTFNTREIIRESGGITQEQFNIALNELRKEIYNTQASSDNQQNTAVWRAISLSQKIDNLSGATFSSGTITSSPISGSTGSFSTLSASGATTLTGDLTVNTNDLYVDTSTGYVGIGTTTPGAKLDVNGNINLPLNTNITAGGIAWMHLSTTQVARIYGNSMSVITGDPRTTRLSIGSSGNFNFNSGQMYVQQSTGNVGIGTTNPSLFKLQIAGNVGPNADNSYNLGAAGSDWGCLYYDSGTLGTCASDERLKENITELTFGDNPMEKLAGLQLRMFNFISDESNSVYKGLIAQEVQEVAPELVIENSDGFLAVKYGDVQWLVIEAVQQLWKIVKENVANILVNKNEIANLKARIANLEAQLAGVGQTSTTGNVGTGTPIITIMGNNPAEIEIGADYSDLGVIARDGNGNDLSVSITVDGIVTTNIEIDTSIDATYTIEYRAQDSSGQVATTTRTVIVGGGATESMGDAEVDETEEDTADASASTTDSKVIEVSEETSNGGTEQSDEPVDEDVGTSKQVEGEDIEIGAPKPDEKLPSTVD